MIKNISTTDLCYSALFICLMAIGANITFWFPFLSIPIGGVSVPLSFQTFFCIMAGLLLGKYIGTLAMVGYIMIGLMGVPVFAQMQAGPFVLFSYTGGFLISFIFVAYVTGYSMEKIRVFTVKISIVISLTGVLVNYMIGITYMYLAMNTWLGLNITYQAAWISMIPFLIKDIGLAFVAALILGKLINRLPRHIRKI
ncbi:biotin transporter BioY [Amphibacillus sp. Q70]|uniref:biotin transporter BioY n=1 Tax=Amphibacillus sp. Q70 TaxID=3453416 RepID=UPI003F872F93